MKCILNNLLCLWIIFIFGYICSSVAILMECPSYQLHFQKIVGFRPPEQYTTGKSFLHRGDNASQICWTICKSDPDCKSYVLFLDNNECYGFSLIDRTIRYDVLPPSVNLVQDANAIYFEKTCLEVPANCKTKLWAITKIPGNSLVFQGGKKTLVVSSLVSRRQCAELCIHETQFACLSASFTSSHKNNYARFGRNFRHYDEVVGQCILSDKDKTKQPDAFQVAPNDEEYIENQCYDRPVEHENCSYELYANSTFIYSELKYDGLTQKECQQNCSHENRFYCQGVSYVANMDLDQLPECFLHSEDIISMGPRSLQTKVNSLYMRRVKCLNVSVVCNDSEMSIAYTPSDGFRGRLYVSSHSEECSVEGNGTKSTVLRLPIGNEARESRCGIIRAYEINGIYQRTFISTLIIVQNNLNVQTQGDRLIKVGCIVNNATYSGGVPDAVALESTLAFTQTELPNEGSLHINASTKIPQIHMQIVDLDKNYETNDVQIGQNLELQIVAEPGGSIFDIQAVSLIAKSDGHNAVRLLDERGCPTDTSVFPAMEKTVTDKKVLSAKFHAFKFAGTSLVSFDVLIHFCINECPSVSCNGGLTSNGRRRKKKRNTPSNEMDFQQFGQSIRANNPPSVISFPGPPNYTNYHDKDTKAQSEIFAYKTTRRSNQDSRIEGQPAEANITEIARNNFTDFKRILGKSLDLPLNLQIYVRGPYVGETESLIYSENSKILVAGIVETKDNKDTFCINQSLLIALLIFWMIFQVLLMVGCCCLIRKYKRFAAIDEDRSSLHKIHESLDYADGRRVRWADERGSSTGFSFHP